MCAFLRLVGGISVAAGVICFFWAYIEPQVSTGTVGLSELMLAGVATSALTMGFVLIGFAAGLDLLTKIANYLARIAANSETPKPDSAKKLEAILKKSDEPALKSKPDEPGVYKI